MAQHKQDIIDKLYKDKFENSIWDQGWDDVVLGSACFSFNKNINHTIVEIHPENRPVAETNSMNKYVGDWRVNKPVWNVDSCIDCQNCWIYCPDSAIISRDKQMIGIDYNHCKGCGICSNVCPTNPKSLVMFDEHTSQEEALNNWPEKTKKEK